MLKSIRCGLSQAGVWVAKDLKKQGQAGRDTAYISVLLHLLCLIDKPSHLKGRQVSCHFALKWSGLADTRAVMVTS